MCGRFAQVIKHDQLKKLMDELSIKNRSEQLEINYNVAPTQPIGAVINKNGEHFLTLFRWGLVPSWSKEPDGKYTLINVRAESILEKPTFKTALLRHRCLIPATGYYEWRIEDKQPFFIKAKDDSILFLAGITEYWTGSDGSFIQSAAIITTSPNELMQSLHNRMPVILPKEIWNNWLDESFHDPGSLRALLIPCPSELLIAYPVSRIVNNVKINSPDCMKPI